MAKEQRRSRDLMANCVAALCFKSNGAVNEETEFGKLKLVTGCFYLPKENEERPLGQDAHFYSQEKQSIGVADGVTGKSEESTANDSGIYARELMSNCVAALHRKSKGSVNPKRVLKKAHSKTGSKGSSTACIVSLNKNRLCYANVGDSGFLVFRSNQCVYTSPIKQTHFNHPYQLNRSTGKIKLDNLVDEGEFKVKAGDIVVLGTDGLLDNLFAREIEDILQNQISCGSTPYTYPQQIADTIGAAAKANSRNRLYNSPFSVAAKLAGLDYVGGKYDDITVVVARIESVERDFIDSSMLDRFLSSQCLWGLKPKDKKETYCIHWQINQLHG